METFASDYTIKRWTYEDAAAMNCAFVNEALAERKWTYAADVIRFYALLKVGGIYMDSDIFLKKRFDDFIPQTGFATFMECYNKAKGEDRITGRLYDGRRAINSARIWWTTMNMSISKMRMAALMMKYPRSEWPMWPKNMDM